ncbi:MAG: N-acetylneuraminate synthase family protein [Treponema sp.]|nr:N-acetylneuraminate synthase family protein [Treponema sp.]
MKGSFCAGGTVYDRRNPLIIAELGTSHGGDLQKARELASAAAEAGASCVKLQMVFADEILHPNTGEVSLPGGRIRLYDRFRQLEKPPEFYAEIKDYIESLGLLFLCTPFGLKSAGILHKLKPKIVKIASPELNFTALLREVAQWGLPVLLSSGVSTLGDIEEAVSVIREAGGKDSPVCLLHCVTAYPAPETDYNLWVLNSLSAVLGVSVGLSDHSLDPELVPALAVSQGAAVIEKHFCLSRGDPGLDDPIALEPSGFAAMVKAIRFAAEKEPDAAVSACREKFGAGKVEAVLGSGIKALAPSERDNYSRSNRSVHALADIHPGDVIKANDIAVLRTEKILRPGLPPSWADRITGRTARRFIPSGEGITFEDI